MTAVWGRRRDWRVAVSLCLVPGLGQLYNRQPRKASFFFVSTLVAAGGAALLVLFNAWLAHAVIGSAALASVLFAFVTVLFLIVLVVIALFFWASAVTDARRTAQALAAGDLEEAARVSFFRL